MDPDVGSAMEMVHSNVEGAEDADSGGRSDAGRVKSLMREWQSNVVLKGSSSGSWFHALVVDDEGVANREVATAVLQDAGKSILVNPHQSDNAPLNMKNGGASIRKNDAYRASNPDKKVKAGKTIDTSMTVVPLVEGSQVHVAGRTVRARSGLHQVVTIVEKNDPPAGISAARHSRFRLLQSKGKGDGYRRGLSVRKSNERGLGTRISTVEFTRRLSAELDENLVVPMAVGEDIRDRAEPSRGL
ncbi:hypothetical protein V6N13_047528 [Hibiscus sabdariffa]